MNSSKTIFDPADPALIHNPQAVYEQLRDDHPLYIATIGGQPIRLLSRYTDVAAVIGAAHSLMNPMGTDAPPAFEDGPAATLWRNALSMMDPPRHTQVRRIIGRPFALRRIDQLRPMVERIVQDVFANFDAAELDVVKDIALQVPMKVICQLLGIPERDWNDLQAWTVDFLRIFLPHASSPAEFQRVQDASQHFLDYFGAMIDERLRRPRDDLTSDFTQLIGAGALTRMGLIGALRGLLTAGFETTAATISAAFLGFARQPRQFEKLRDNPDLIPGAVEELLRWETPTQVTVRYLGREVQLRESLLEPGEAVWLLLGAANYDPRHYPNPARIDILRAASDHFAFGGGRHFCLGAYLAKLELQSTLRHLVAQYRRIELQSDSIKRRPHFQFRSIETLPVALHSG